MIKLLLVFVALALAPMPPSLDEKVVAFARSKLGQKVGDGQCSALAAESLRAAGARPRGEEVKVIADVRPGDVLQFEDVVFIQRRVRADGVRIKQTLKSPKHFAVVSAVQGVGKDLELTVLHQNAGFRGTDEEAKKVVQEWSFTLSEKKAGVLKAFRPVAANFDQLDGGDR